MNRTVKVRANWMGGMRIDAETDKHQVIIDQPEAMGGKDEGANPMEYLLFTLGSCLGTVAAIAARQQQIDLRGFSVALEGEYDSDYLLGKTTEGRAGFNEIRVSVKIDADLTPEEKQAFLDVVDSRCPVTDNILHKTRIKFELEK
jgi:putative redox protein